MKRQNGADLTKTVISPGESAPSGDGPRTAGEGDPRKLTG